MRKHSKSSISHTLIAWKFNNEADRLTGTLPSTAVVTFVESDLGRRAYDIDTMTFWDISDVVAGVPTWISGGGPAGVFGGDSQPYTYSTTTSDSDPGSGVIRFDNTTLSSVTKAYIDLANSDFVDVTAWIDALDDSSSTIKGTLRVVKKTDQSIFHTFQINAANTTATGYRKLNLTYVTGNGSFADTEEIVVSFTRQGDVGATGATGDIGSTGANGPGYYATSTTSLLIAAASKTFTTQSGLAYSVGARVRASSAANTANYMEGLATSYSGTTLVISVDHTSGSGTYDDWNINLAGDVGATGPAGSGGDIALIPGVAWKIHTSLGVGDWSSADINNGGQSVLVTTDTGSVGSVYLSTDGLSTLNEFTSTPPGHSRYHDCGLSTDFQTIIATGDTVFRYSTDQGGSWGGAVQSSAPTNECCALTKSGTLQFVFAQDTTTYLRYNGTTGKTHGLSDASGITIDTTGDKCVVSSTTGGCVYSTNVSAGSPTFTASSGISGNVVAVAGGLSGVDIFAAKYSDYLYKSSDSGASFAAQTEWGVRNWEGVVCSGDSLTIVSWTDTQVFRSTDGGVTVYEITPADITGIAALGMSEDGFSLVIGETSGYLYTITLNPGATGATGATGADGIGTAASVGTLVNSLTAKTTPVGADLIGIRDSVTGDWQKLSFTDLIAYLNTLYSGGAVSAFDSFPMGYVLESPVDLETVTAGDFLRLDGRRITRASVHADFADLHPIGSFSPTKRTLNAANGNGAGASDSTNFLIAGAQGTSPLQASADGVTWSTSATWGASTFPYCIIKAGSRFIMQGSGGDLTTACYVSATDQTAANAVVKSNWTATTGGPIATGYANGCSLTYCSSLGLTVGIKNHGSASTNIYTLADASTTWATQTLPSSQTLIAVVWTGTTILAFNDSAAFFPILQKSTNGTAWTESSFPFLLTSAMSVASDDNGTVVIVADIFGGGAVLVSKDHGVTWLLIPVGEYVVFGGANVKYLNGRFIIYTSTTPTQYYFSEDAFNWFASDLQTGTVYSKYFFKSGVLLMCSTSTSALTVTEDSTYFKLRTDARGSISGGSKFGSPMAKFIKAVPAS